MTVAIGAPDGSWRREKVELTGATASVTVAADEAVLLDVEESSWLVAELDASTQDLLPTLVATLDDDPLRASLWNNVRSSFEVAATTPGHVLALAALSIPTEPSDEPLSFNEHAGDPSKLLLTEWLITKVAPLAADPLQAGEALHQAFLARAVSAEPGSTVQYAAFQGAVETCASATRLRGWLDGGVPDGVSLDLSLRWRILARRAALGDLDHASLDRHLAAERTGTSTVAHARAVASLPTPEAKAWAWDRFLGVADVANYELQASGQGMWRPGQESLTDPYVDRFFDELPGTSAHRSGWLVADAACWFFPLTSLTDETVARAEALAHDEDVDHTLRRQMAIMADEVRRRIAVRSKS